MAEVLPSLNNTIKGNKIHWGGLSGCSESLAIAETAAAYDGILLVTTISSAEANRLEQEVSFFLAAEDDIPVIHFPDWETLPYDTFSPHQDIVSERLQALHQLPRQRRGVLITPISTLMHRLTPASFIEANAFVHKTGDSLDSDQYRTRLQESGYRCVDTVYEHGEFAVRGAVIDIYPMGSKHPYRIDLFDDEIETLRSFDIESQRTISKVDEIKLLPAREYPLDKAGIRLFKNQSYELFGDRAKDSTLFKDVFQGIAPAGIEYYLPLFFEQTQTLLDFLPNNTLALSQTGAFDAGKTFWHDVCERYETRAIDPRQPILPPQYLFNSLEDLFAQLKNYTNISLSGLPIDAGSGKHNLPINSITSFTDTPTASPYEGLTEYLANYQGRVIFCCESAGRREAMLEQLNKHGIKPRTLNQWHEFTLGSDRFAIIVGPLQQSAVFEQRICIITEASLFGQRVMQSRRRKKVADNTDAIIRNLTELKIGAPVVHLDHGVGRYLGLQNLGIDGQEVEFLTLKYANDTKLYVPVSSLNLISRYSGSDDEHAPLHKLGNEQWAKAKRKAVEQIHDVAAELLDIYARRAARKGESLAASPDNYNLFSAGFPFEETQDQEAAIDAVRNDLRANTPMDRLVCGDVGFGKTEVAMRAAFIAAEAGKQIAILVPTTLLAQQHYESFCDRFADWPVNIEVISRFKTAAEQKGVIEKLANGSVDIIIGTHKLIQSNIKYQNLGLLIIDEEHRFGVKQKEQLKSLRAQVDILTMTATPIPRTLNMAMSGMRDLSIIATPPAKRLSVKTFVQERQDAVIKEAILRELLRGGQVYLLHNEVKSIEKTAREIEALVPEARVAIGHGQMREKELEQVMSDFYHKRYNVLVCTTIVETGIDIPSANTMIIDRADKFGLAQLHQLRGRVGRSHHQAYAYLLTPHTKALSKDAHKRLDAISEAQELGAGFTLATHDMEIRGAGELLGDEQSGQIQTVGFSLYMEMLEEAIDAIKQGKTPNIEKALNQGSEVDMKIAALIPDNYLPDVHGRLILYKRISGAKNDADLRELQIEMIDRFGLLPEQVKNLFDITALRIKVEALGINKLEAGTEKGRIIFGSNTTIEPINIVQLVQSKPASYQLEGANTLRFNGKMEQNSQRFEAVNKLLDALAG
ncbi:Transcription-repair-coupling factor [Sinobacterium norvegicum]|uniref:Transcription-repair-coupling factor n=1 Tax=Sinobacterium norvegicum TaxID=1641715 RepID=A0ABN8EEN0_9GAMM|nr:transcription-repair coupling factor [Sinobacterium norvegicum]CAH0989985.1 Transcription-repair-coupling factor [Sinobacterium norvegicum]